IEHLEPRQLLSAVWYVDVNAPGPSHDGTSWDTAFQDLQQALTSATAGSEIHVADGTYRPTDSPDKNIAFELKNGVSVMGGYDGGGAPDPDHRDPLGNPTTLSGDIGVIGSNTDNSMHVVDASLVDTTAVLDGVIVTAGNASNGTGGGAG